MHQGFSNLLQQDQNTFSYPFQYGLITFTYLIFTCQNRLQILFHSDLMYIFFCFQCLNTAVQFTQQYLFINFVFQYEGSDAHLERPLRKLKFFIGCKQYNLRLYIFLLHLRHQVKACHDRHFDICDNNIRAIPFCVFQSYLSVPCVGKQFKTVSFPINQTDQIFSCQIHVLDYQYLIHFLPPPIILLFIITHFQNIPLIYFKCFLQLFKIILRIMHLSPGRDGSARIFLLYREPRIPFRTAKKRQCPHHTVFSLYLLFYAALLTAFRRTGPTASAAAILIRSPGT